ncbi:Cell division protein GpsB [Streptococcus sp. DD10]|uniref:cell division regulator GpsB n=1 Tax=Streptococcus sp. DD10 TaxID=1777878 RepID=UPI00079585EA|nr:cell division regulator GpsB [Streptococcus sp. DD10]KXT77167.1 Cell division protein GpsB [Streptococcus sp. DD10]
MASIIHTPKDIFEQDFKTAVRGYSKQEVDEFLDDVIKDYETYEALVKDLRDEVARLKAAKASDSSKSTPFQQSSSAFSQSSQSIDIPQPNSATNFDILRRLNRLEKEVFGKRILDTDL